MDTESLRVMIWGGTRGLGKQLAVQSVGRGHFTWITGRDPDEAMKDPDLVGIAKCDYAEFGRLPVDPDPPRLVGRDFLVHSLNADILFWVAGHWLRKPFWECMPGELVEMANAQLLGPMLHLKHVLARRVQEGKPPHLVVVSSSSAVKVRSDGQALYGAVQAAKVQLVRNLHAELAVRFPDVRTTIVRPGGMKTGFFDGSDVDTSTFADPAEVAEAIWSRVRAEDRPGLLEMDLAQQGDRLAVSCTPHDPLCP